MSKSKKAKPEELSIDDRLDQIIDWKKNENSALIKIAISLKNEHKKQRQPEKLSGTQKARQDKYLKR